MLLFVTVVNLVLWLILVKYRATKTIVRVVAIVLIVSTSFAFGFVSYDQILVPTGLSENFTFPKSALAAGILSADISIFIALILIPVPKKLGHHREHPNFGPHM